MVRAAVAGGHVTEAAMRRVGVSLGAGVIAPLPVEACGVVETARVLAYLAASSARQCGPCLFGLPDMAELVGRIASGRSGRSDLKTLDRFMSEVAGRGACHHPDGAVRLAISALRTFNSALRLLLAVRRSDPFPAPSTPNPLKEEMKCDPSPSPSSPQTT